MNGKKLTALALASALFAGTFAGCGTLKPAETVATLNGRAIEAGLVNFVAQNTAASYDTYMAGYYGADMWEQEMGSTEGETLADEVRQNALDEIELQYLLDEHMADYGVTISEEELSEIDAVTAEFLSENTEEALKIMGATEAYVKEMLRLKLVESKMEDAIKATADTEVSDEELAERNASEETEEAEEADAEETEEEAESEEPAVTAEDIIAERQDALYDEVVEGYKATADFTVNENVLKKISFKKFLQIVSDEEESETGVEETESAAGTESVLETEAAGE